MSFKINRVYTRSGDQGKTGLVGGARVSKSDLRIEAVGSLDELNSSLAIIKEEVTKNTFELRDIIEYLQQDLFDLGAEIATPKEAYYEKMWQASKDDVKALECLCDFFGKDLPELESFILPGGSRLSASCHLARAIARRAERRIVELNELLTSETKDHQLNPEAISYINRLSDVLFNMARWILVREKRQAPLWVPARERKLDIGK